MVIFHSFLYVLPEGMEYSQLDMAARNGTSQRARGRNQAGDRAWNPTFLKWRSIIYPLVNYIAIENGHL